MIFKVVSTAHIRVYTRVLSPLESFIFMLFHGHIPQELSANPLILLKEHLAWELISESYRLLWRKARIDLGYSVNLRLYYHEVLHDLGCARLTVHTMIKWLNLAQTWAELEGRRRLNATIMPSLLVMSLWIKHFWGW